MVVLVRRRVRETSWCVRELGIRGGAFSEQPEDRCFKYLYVRVSRFATPCVFGRSRNLATWRMKWKLQARLLEKRLEEEKLKGKWRVIGGWEIIYSYVV